MSRKVTIKLETGEASVPDEPTEAKRVPRVARILALAHRWNDLIRSGDVRDRAELSRLVGVSRARVSQVMRLLDLAPHIQEEILLGEAYGRVSEKVLRSTAHAAVWAAQVPRRAAEPSRPTA